MTKHLVFIIIFFSSVTLFAQTKKAITHEDMWLMKRVGAPKISANGKWIVFSVTHPAYDEKDQSTDLWLARADGSSKPRKITSTKAGESGYTWNPDSKTIAFIAKREGDEVAQVYTINIEDGGEAERITNLSTGAASPQWSPDGKMLLFTSNVYPGATADSISKKMAEEKKKIKYKARIYHSFPIREWDHWLDEKQTHFFVQKAESTDSARNLFASVDLVRQDGFRLVGNGSWSADGKQIIFSATIESNAAAFKDVVAGLYSIAVDGGNATALLNDGSSYYNAQMSSDGKNLFCLSTPENNYKTYNLPRLLRFNWPSMQGRTVLAQALDRPINNFELKGNDVVMSVETEGLDKLYSIAGTETEARPVTNNSIGCYNNISVSNNGSIAANFESASAPPEVVLINGNAHWAISNFNEAKLASLDLQPVETFWVANGKGKNIRGMLVRPAGFDSTKKYPLFVVMHGGPSISYKDNWGYRWNYHLLAAPGYVLVLTDYTGSTGYGEKFSQDIQYNPFKGAADEINQAAAFAIKKYPFIDGSRQAAGGASYGGHLANWMQATTTHYKCLISHAGLMNSESQWGTSDGIYGREVMNGGTHWSGAKTWKEQNPIRFAANFKTPVLITVGELDYRVPINNSIENFHVMQRLKIPSKLVVFPEENHWILKAENSRFFYQEVHAWLKKYLN